MKRIGKIFLGVLCAAALAAGGFWIDDRLSYPIDPGMDGLEGSLTNWLNRGIDAVHGYQPRLHEPVTLGERTYVPMEVGEKLGYALLERSITGRYRIAHTSSGNAPFRCGVIEENGGKQLLFQGRNTFGEIDRVQITLDRGCEYELKLPRKEVFFIHTGVDSRIPTGLASVEQITLYDGEGQDITESFFMSMGGIQ